MCDPKKKERIDRLLVRRGLAESREKAKALLMEGRVTIKGKKIEKVGTLVYHHDIIEIIGGNKYISRGGLKLEKALNQFLVHVIDSIAMDVGASTGGFTDCLLQHGAKKVYAVDVGYGQLDWKLRMNPKVKSIEKTNIRYINNDLIKDPIDIAVIDVSFISLEKVLPVVIKFLKKAGEIIALIKPQFEVGKKDVGKGGIVRIENKRLEVVEKIKKFAIGLDLNVKGIVESPIKGSKGNVEYFIHLSF